MQVVMVIGLSGVQFSPIQWSPITSMITDRIGQHKVLLPINQNYDKIKERNKTFVLHFYNKKNQLTCQNVKQ